nr:hypothetical protein TetV2_00364 [Oceanusvirus sp.]
MGGVVSAFRAVIEVFETVIKLITGFPQNLVCLLKLVLLGLLRYVFLEIPGVYHASTFLIYWFPFAIQAIPRSVTGVLTLAFVALVWMIDKFFGSWSNTNAESGGTVGQSVRSFLQVFTTCLNDPRAWYLNSRYHKNNRHNKLLGIYPCMSPCKGAYKNYFGGLLCKRAEKTSPEFCPLAAITRVVDGLPYEPSVWFDLDEPDCSKEEEGEFQTELADAACSQPTMVEGKFLRTACYQRYCTSNPEKGGISRCVDMVPFESREKPVLTQIMQIPALLLTGASFFFTLVTSVQERQHMYTTENQQWIFQNKVSIHKEM